MWYMSIVVSLQMRNRGLREVLIYQREQVSEMDLILGQVMAPAQGNVLSLSSQARRQH